MCFSGCFCAYVRAAILLTSHQFVPNGDTLTKAVLDVLKEVVGVLNTSPRILYHVSESCAACVFFLSLCCSAHATCAFSHLVRVLFVSAVSLCPRLCCLLT